MRQADIDKFIARINFIKLPPDDATSLERALHWRRFYIRRLPLAVVGFAVAAFLTKQWWLFPVGVVGSWGTGFAWASLSVREIKRRDGQS